MRQAILVALPSTDREVKLHQAVAALGKLREAPMLVDGQVVEALQLVEAVREQLEQLGGSAGPAMGANPSPTRRLLFDAYSNFFSWSVLVQQPDQEPVLKTLRGKAGFHACQMLMRERFTSAPTTMRMSWLKPMHGLRWMMGEEGEKEFREWMVQAHSCDDEPQEEDTPTLELPQEVGQAVLGKHTTSSPTKSPAKKGALMAKVLDAVLHGNVSLSPSAARKAAVVCNDLESGAMVDDRSAKKRRMLQDRGLDEIVATRVQ